MPSDIRSFFGGKPAGSPAEPAKPKKAEEPKKRGRARKVVEDDEDDEPAPKKATPKKSSAKKQLESEPVMEETTADDFFGKGNKPKRSEPVRPKAPSKPAIKKEAEEESKPTKSTSKKATPNGKTSTRNKPTKSYAEFDADDFPDDDMEDDADDVFKAGAKSGRKMDDAYEEGTDDEDNAPIQPKRTAGRTGKQKTLRGHDQDDADEDVEMKDTNADDDFVVPDDDEEIVEDKPATKTKSAAAKKRKAPVVDDDDDDDDLDVEETKPTRKRASPVKKATPAKKQKKEEPKTNNSVQAIFDSIPTIEPPSPSGDGDTKKKFQYGQHKNAEAPAGAIDPSDYPTGQDNCLAGLSFVFTGQLATLGREAGSALVKQYGGKVMTAPSKKTSYVVLGEEAGPKKIQTIKAHKLKVIQEEGLFDLIRKLPANGGDSAAAEEYAKKQQKEEENIRKAAAEMEQQERAKLAAAKPKPQANGSASASQQSGKARAEGQDPKNQLWTVRYAPQSLSQICGNKAQVEKLGRWLRAFPKNQRTNFKMPGADGSGTFRAVMIHGPPGIGKTTAAHLVAKLEGYDIVESNASDTRSKKLIENSLKGVLSTTSLMGYFSSGADQVEASKKKLVLIMDEVDGLSAGDRGGVGAIAAVAKKSQIPMILICNERKQPKMKPFDFVTYDLGFRRPTTEMIRSRISSIAYKEELKMPANVMTALIEGTGADIRQVINMISTAKLDAANMSYEDSKDMSKAWEKHIVLKPWDMVGKILNGSMFNPANNSSLNDKQELYFNDHDFAPLMLQENYLGTKPTRSGKYNAQPKKKALADLDLISKAADSISDGDLVDRMIHGSQQQWSLMPTHAMFSFVRPASFVYGSMAGNQTRFTSWMGKNSTQGKLMRMIKEIQGHMRLRTSGDRFEIRQTYLPLLFDRLIKRLQVEGKDAVPEIIELMDEYFLTKDDWDAIMELGVGDADMEKIKIETQAKATFTRLYNQKSHPLPFIKSSQVVAPKKGATKEKPDLEEALEESEEEAADDADVKEEDDNDLSKDKYVKAPKKKRAPAAKGKGKGKKAADDDDDDDEDVKPARGKGKAAAGKGRAKK